MTNPAALPADWRDFLALTKPRVMSLVVFSGLCGMLVAPVQLPPSIVKTASYRCEDNKVIYVDWLSDGKSANIRLDKGATPTQVTAPEAGKPMTGAAGYSLDGTSTASTIKIGIPGHPSQSCSV